MNIPLCPAVTRLQTQSAATFRTPRAIRTKCEDAALEAATEIAAAVLGAICSVGINRDADFAVEVVRDDAKAGEEYELESDGCGCRIRAASDAAVHRAFATLAQLFICGDFPALKICDEAKLEQRGYMLDISRDRVPARRTLLHILDLLWLLKYNQLQLYVEHSFAFPGHDTVWRDASPLHPADVEWLQDQCDARGIELVPNMNSLGHFGRWLQRPEYRIYSECPEGCTLPNGRVMPAGGTTLRPGPETLAFLRGLYDSYLPLFRSTKFNAGMDEPWELGLGKSREACERSGRHRMYLDHLQAVAKMAAAHGKTIQFWADIVLEAPEYVAELPEGITGMIWGYEAGHPFDSQCASFAKAGVPFVVCPGTSGWNSIAGRWQNSRTNIEEAAAAATAHSARGMLLTDWGDNGHHQPPCASLPPLALFADAAWNGTASVDVEKVLNRILLRDHPGISGKVLTDLGSIAERHFKTRIHNCTASWKMFFADEAELKNLLTEEDAAQVAAFRRELADIRNRIARARPAAFGSGLVRQEMELAAKMLDAGASRFERVLGLRPGGPEYRTAELADEFEALWLKRSERGGLPESLARFPSIM